MIDLDAIERTIRRCVIEAENEKSLLALVAELRAARAVVEAVRGSMPYLDGTIGPCEDGCDCLLQDLHATLDAYNDVAVADPPKDGDK